MKNLLFVASYFLHGFLPFESASLPPAATLVSRLLLMPTSFAPTSSPTRYLKCAPAAVASSPCVVRYSRSTATSCWRLTWKDLCKLHFETRV